MSSEDDKSGVSTPGHQPDPAIEREDSQSPAAPAEAQRSESEIAPHDVVDGAYTGYDDPYAYPDSEAPASTTTVAEATPPPVPAAASGGSAEPPSDAKEDTGDDDDEGMLRMSFMEHLEELRSRLLWCLAGIGIAFALSLTFANQLWVIVSDPAIDALRELGYANTKLAQISPMDTFTTVWVKLPMLTAIFIASPWILYQVWSFIAPGLYRRERRWAWPFIVCSAGLFILGGVFAYFVAFRFGVKFLLGIGRDINIDPYVSITEYFDLFVNVALGVGLVFELPVLIFFLTLLRIVTPSFLIRNSRYAILLIVVAAAILTPTPDVINLSLFAGPMILLYFVGIFASYILVLSREGRRFPWGIAVLILSVMVLVTLGLAYYASVKYGYKFIRHWPFFVR
jgi:sec-independent protein translocase protein TatC